MKKGSLFTGAMGADLGAEAAGMEPVWYCENDAAAAGVIAFHAPHKPIYCDITKFKPDPINDAVDVIFGGSPCQDLSVAGLRAGLDGERSGLFHQMVRVCKRLRPRFVVWENVPGAFSSNASRDFAAVIRAFTGLQVAPPHDGWGNAGFVRTPFPSLRWNVAWRVFDSQHCGVPQRRRRIFLVASLGDASCAEILFEPESVRGDHPPCRGARQGVAPTNSARTKGGGGLGTDAELGGALIATALTTTPYADRESQETNLVVGTVSSKWEKGTGGPAGDECQNLIAHTLRGDGFDASEDGTGRGTPLLPVAFRTTGNDGCYETGDSAACLNTVTDPNQNIIVFQSRFVRNGRGAPSDIAPCLISEGKGDCAPLVKTRWGVRRFTPLECERLQGWPDLHTLHKRSVKLVSNQWIPCDEIKEQADGPRYKQIGNGVTAPVAKWIAERILRYA